jgi:uncharacterized protein (DUF924 family)
VLGVAALALGMPGTAVADPFREQDKPVLPLAGAQQFADEASDVAEQVSAIGRSVGWLVSRAASYTDAELAERFERLANRCGFAGQKLKELDPPTRQAKQSVLALIVALRAVRKDLRRISSAAAASDPEAARAATESLVDHSPAVRRANDALKAEIRRIRNR